MVPAASPADGGPPAARLERFDRIDDGNFYYRDVI
jgi:hypothetical protein